MFRAKGRQQTIKEEVEFSGHGLHTGNQVQLRCLPAGPDSGIVFRRVDLPSKPEIKAEPGQVVSTTRCTSIGFEKGEVPLVKTIEHIMAAIWAFDIDNLVIEIDGPETPVADGSAYPFLELLQQAGKCRQESARKILEIEEAVWLRRGRVYMVILPYQGFKVSYTLDYENPVLGTQFREFDSGEDSFAEEIARARTFGFKREVEALQKRGLALGGSLKNAVLIDGETTVNELRYQDEFVRHKILDVIGDMALNGFVAGHIITARSGHSLHIELAQEISKMMRAGE